MHNGKIAFLNKKRIHRVPTKKYTLDSYVSELNPDGEDEKQSHRSLVNLDSFTW